MRRRLYLMTVFTEPDIELLVVRIKHGTAGAVHSVYA